MMNRRYRVTNHEDCKTSRPAFSRRTFCASVLTSLGMASGCGSKTRPLGPHRPPIVLVVLDTVRADHLSGWGYRRRTSPWMDALGKTASVYRRAYATAPWTLPSHVTLFTGQYSFQHGIEAVLQKDPTGNEQIYDPPLPASAVTLAEILRAEGYATAAFTANTPYMQKWFNLGQGFDVYDVQRRPGVEMVEPASAWAGGQQEKPFFLFLNFMDAHLHYNTKPCPGAFDEPVSQDESLALKLIEAVLPGEKPADDALARDVTAQYDMGIANADYATGQVLEQLKMRGRFDDALIIITSDHGEYLGEHLLAQHSKDLYEEALWVPLLVKAPGQQEGRRHEHPVSLVQVCGTIRKAARVSQDASKPRSPDLDTAAPLLAEIHYSRNWDYTHPVWGKRFRRLRTAYYAPPWKLIYSSDERHELYHLREDPKETRNRFAEEHERASAMLRDLAAIKPLSTVPVTSREGVPPTLTDEEKQALKTGGYL